MDKKIILVGTSEEKDLIRGLLIEKLSNDFEILTIKEKENMIVDSFIGQTNYGTGYLDLNLDLGIIKTVEVENADYIYISKRFITIKQYRAELLENLFYLSSIFIETYKKLIYKKVLFYRKCSMILRTFSNLRFV